MSSFSTQWPGDFESLARQYWNAWGDNLRRQAGAGLGMNAAPDWQQAVQWWSQLVPGQQGPVTDVLGRFNAQASDWYGRMQQVAAQFAGVQGNAAEIGQAWREALGANAENLATGLFPEMIRAMRGGGQHAGLDEWITQAMPFVESLRRERSKWLHLPTFGLSREHQERWQQLALAQDEYQQRNDEFNRLMAKATQRAFELFERKLAEHEAPEKQLTSVRALFDLWIDAAEDAYAESALSPEFGEVYGALTNAQMRLRGCMQREVEQFCGLLGMPSRTEVDSAHRKIAELERALRKASLAAAKGKPVAAVRARPVATPLPAGPLTVEEPAAAVSPLPTSPTPAVSKAAATKKASPRKRSVAAKAKSTGKVAAGKKPPSRAKAPVNRKSAVAKKKAAKRVDVKNSTPAAPRKAAEAKSRKSPPTRKAKPAPGKTPADKAAVPRKRAPAVGKPASAPVAATPANVVSMKDWVARNIAGRDDDGQREGAQRKSRNGKRGARK